MRFQNFLLFLIPYISFFGDQIPVEDLPNENAKLQVPWFTGPLLTPSPVNVPKGHTNFEPYLFVVSFDGKYDNNWKRTKKAHLWNTYFQPSLQIGVLDFLEVDLYPNIFANFASGARDWLWGDLLFSFCFQLLQTKRPLDEWNTALRIELRGVIPFGPYQKLNPKDKGTGIGGQGSWDPGVSIDWGNIFYLGSGHFLSWRTSFIYTVPNPVKVQGLSAYGGDERTLGTVYPERSFLISSGMELSLTQNWVVVMEAQALWGGKQRFKGITTLPLSSPPTALVSISPAIEYNWSSKIGIIFGPWLTLTGRNTLSFSGGIFAFNYFN